MSGASAAEKVAARRTMPDASSGPEHAQSLANPERVKLQR
jgi:hypothetical protein